MSEHIKPCPFCGSHEVTVCRTNKHACWIQCDECGGEIGSAPSRQEAIELWNCRTDDDGQPAIVTHDMDKEAGEQR